jgi:hypothetical protein
LWSGRRRPGKLEAKQMEVRSGRRWSSIAEVRQRGEA